ncbi:MAG: hypothetical protein ACYTEG_13070 [Planctomycetota bacterium]|jgi:hypothetical protein
METQAFRGGPGLLLALVLFLLAPVAVAQDPGAPARPDGTTNWITDGADVITSQRALWIAIGIRATPRFRHPDLPS